MDLLFGPPDFSKVVLAHLLSYSGQPSHYLVSRLPLQTAARPPPRAAPFHTRGLPDDLYERHTHPLFRHRTTHSPGRFVYTLLRISIYLSFHGDN
ncbi:hypothetical protein E2C01_070496 [Portunus trituberculatus]|uniref:Uncharacterized protein n=1 Tax=Portunus trituberculatus TaxID=210409 RepID=A0A5B7HXG1_PORTR|nr:hypothetical protein [Portunus trituberculatus]